MRTKTLWLWLALLVTSLALVAAGCGGDDDEAAGTGATTEGGTEAAEQVITVNWGTEPPSLDPGLATDVTSSNILLNIMDPLVKLDEDLNPVGSAAESFETSEDGKTVTYTLRDGLKWTNGDPVTAHDFEYSWKRTVSPELGADYAYQFYGIVGAQEYNSCDPKKDDCDALKAKMGVKARRRQDPRGQADDPAAVVHPAVGAHSFLAVNQKAVEQFGDNWTEPANIVTNGPFKLESWEHNASIDLVKWDGWRDADRVKLTRVNGRMISDGTTAVQAFEAGEIDVALPGPAAGRDRAPEGDARVRAVPGVSAPTTTGSTSRTSPTSSSAGRWRWRSRRQSIIDNVAQGGPAAGDRHDAQGHARIRHDQPGLAVAARRRRHGAGEAADERGRQPEEDITLYINDSPGHRDIAVAIQAAWKELGITTTIKQQEFPQFLEFLGPPPNQDVDVYRLGWIGDFVDAINFLDLWTCESGNNNTNYCNKDFDAKIEEGEHHLDNDARYELYGEAEDILFGENGDMPIIPIYFYTYPSSRS